VGVEPVRARGGVCEEVIEAARLHGRQRMRAAL
jgi:hypothetical protein